jgi:hypothetical protein
MGWHWSSTFFCTDLAEAGMTRDELQQMTGGINKVDAGG